MALIKSVAQLMISITSQLSADLQPAGCPFVPPCATMYMHVVIFIKPLSSLVEGVQLIHSYQSAPHGPN